MNNKYTLISLMVLMIIAGFAAWRSFLSFQPQNNGTPVRTIQLPDALMENVSALILDKQGKPKMKIATPKMVHYAANDMTHLTLPQLTLYRKSPNPWFVTSKFAQASQGIENVDFKDDVVIQHAADETNPATLIKTLTLTVHPNKQTAETNDIITLLQPNLTVHATGMFADLNTGDIKFLSAARGEYVPNS